jgi:hypothetical protein
MQRTMLPEGEAAVVVGVSPRTLQKWRLVGGGPVFTKLGRSVRYAMADLEAFLQQRRRVSTSDIGNASLATTSNSA